MLTGLVELARQAIANRSLGAECHPRAALLGEQHAEIEAAWSTNLRVMARLMFDTGVNRLPALAKRIPDVDGDEARWLRVEGMHSKDGKTSWCEKTLEIPARARFSFGQPATPVALDTLADKLGTRPSNGGIRTLVRRDISFDLTTPLYNHTVVLRIQTMIHCDVPQRASLGNPCAVKDAGFRPTQHGIHVEASHISGSPRRDRTAAAYH